MPSSAVQVRVDDSIGTIILDRADHENALTRAMLQSITEALGDLHQEKRVRSVIFSGAGKTFSIGRESAEQIASEDPMLDLKRWGEETKEYCDLLVAMLEFPKPLIAAVNGPALAGGAGLVLACDIVVACEEASFGFPEPKYGTVAGVAAPLLSYRIGAGTAARLLVGAQAIEAVEAHRLGLYHEIVTQDLVWAHAAKIGRSCGESAPQSLQLTKRLLYETIGEQLATQLVSGAVASATALTTHAAREGLAAKQAGRTPDWDAI